MKRQQTIAAGPVSFSSCFTMQCTWLSNKGVMELHPPANTVTCVTSNLLVSKAYQTLVERKYQSAPVYDEESKQFIALVDINDILSVTLMILSEENLKEFEAKHPGATLSTILSAEDRFKQLRVYQIANLSQRNPYVPLPSRSTLRECVELMLEKKLHRVPIVDESGRLVNFISQSSVLACLWQQRAEWVDRIGRETMEQLKLLERSRHNGAPIISITEDHTALAAFRILAELHLSGVPVVDRKNKLLASLSMQDLKEVGTDASSLHLLNEPVLKYISHAHHAKKYRIFSTEKPIHFHGKETLAEIIQKVVEQRVHRIYYVDVHTHQLSGVITLHELIQLFV